MDKILITGAAGFIGHKLFNHLKTRYNVLGVDFNLKEKLNDKIVIRFIERENISKLLDSFDQILFFI